MVLGVRIPLQAKVSQVVKSLQTPLTCFRCPLQSRRSGNLTIYWMFLWLMRSVSCGRLHSSCLDRNNKIWTFVSWGRPFYLSSPIISDPGFIPIQIECGWSFSSILTQHGEVFVWWPYDGAMAEAIRAKLHEMDETQDNVQAQDGVIPCASWALEGVPPTRLPPLPTLPDLPHDQSEKEEIIQLIQIAAFDNNLIGLTNHGHVLKYGSLHNEEQALQGRWEYVGLIACQSEEDKLTLTGSSQNLAS